MSEAANVLRLSSPDAGENVAGAGDEKTGGADFLSEHGSRRDIFKGSAVAFKHAFQDLAQLHIRLR
jgi:hypothetical protein